MRGKKVSTLEKARRLSEDAGERRRVFLELCKHVGNGYSLDCFETLSIATIKRYLEIYKDEFVEEELEKAMRKGKLVWENIGHRQSNGTCMGNSRTWYYNMSNRYGWREKIDVEAEHKGNINVSIVSYANAKALEDTREKT